MIKQSVTLHDAIKGMDVQIDLEENEDGKVVVLYLKSPTTEVAVAGIHETGHGCALIRYDDSGSNETGMDLDGNIPFYDDAEVRKAQSAELSE